MSDRKTSIGLRGLGCALPERFTPLAELPLTSSAETLAGFGFTGAYLAEDPHQLAVAATQKALTDAALLPREIDALLFAGAMPLAHQRPSEQSSSSPLGSFCYVGSWLQEELGLDRATVSGIAQQG